MKKSKIKDYNDTVEHDVISQLLELVPVHSIYLLQISTDKNSQIINMPPTNKRSKIIKSYTLFVITYKPISKNLGLLMDDLYNKTQQKYRVYLITMVLSTAIKELNYGSNFLLNILKRTPCIFKDNDNLDKFIGFGLLYDPNFYEHIHRVWKNRMQRANYWISMVYVDDSKEDEFVNLGMLNYGLEQICVALIYVFWEFNPSYYSLPYLMHLCSHFSDLPQAYFLKSTYQRKRTFYLLSNARNQMRFKAFQEYSSHDSKKAYNLCEQFLQEATTIGDKQLSEIKLLHYKGK